MSEFLQLLRQESRRHPSQAAHWLDLATGAFPKNASLDVLRASVALRSNDATLAVARFIAAMQRFPGHDEITQGLARALEKAGLPDAALENWLQLANTDPRQPNRLTRTWALLEQLGLANLPSCKRLSRAELPHLRAEHRPGLHRALRTLGDDPGHLGAVWIEGAFLKGWILDRVFPTQRPEIRVYFDGRLGAELAPSEPFPVGRAFTCALPELPKDIGLIIDVLAGDGVRLSGAPIRYGAVPPPPKCLPPSTSLGRTSRRVDVVIPVYRDRALAAQCIASVLASRTANHTRFRLVLVNDCSPEPGIQPWLRAVARDSQGVYLQTPRNLGFIGAINLAMDVCKGSDMIWLNSDTLVCGDWIDRLNAAAGSSPDVATVTPLSNNAQLFSYPQTIKDNPTPSAPETEKLHRLAGLANDGTYEEVPTGIGFCMYLKAEALSAAGRLDDQAYLLGYAEEIDYAFRLSAAGWRHLCATDVFVAHRGGASFQFDKARLVKDNDLVIQQRYPLQSEGIHRFQRRDPLSKARASLEGLWLAEHREWDGLFLVSATAASRYVVQDILHERWLAGARDLQMRCSEDRQGLSIRLEGTLEAPPRNLRFRIPQHRAELTRVLLTLAIRDRITVFHDRAFPPLLFDVLSIKSGTFDLICLDDTLERDAGLRARLPANHVQYWHSRYRMARWQRSAKPENRIRSLSHRVDPRWTIATPGTKPAWVAIWTQGIKASEQARLSDLIRIGQPHVRWLLVGEVLDEPSLSSTGRCECLPAPSPATLLKHLAWIGCQCILCPTPPGPDPSAFLASRRLMIPYVGTKAADGLTYLTEPETYGAPARATPQELLDITLEAIAQRRDQRR